MRGVTILVAALLSVPAGCNCRQAPSETPAKVETTMTGATSPTGERHPGEILHDDKVDGRTWTRRAEEVPQSVAWVQAADGRWVAVVKIVITGSAARREMAKFGPDGQFLETTVQAPPPPSGR